MDIVECVNNRKVTRGYLSRPVPRELLAKILDAARNTASTENTQPWEFAVFSGQVMEQIRAAYQECFNSGAAPSPDIPYDQSSWPEDFVFRRMGGGGPNLLTVLNIDPNDAEARQKLMARAFGFWNAPVGIIIYTERNLPTLSFLDVGGVLQTILLLAHNYGLGTCPMLAMVFYPDILRRLLKIPSSKILHIGISIGYPDNKDVINSLKSFRLPLDTMVTWHGI